MVEISLLHMLSMLRCRKWLERGRCGGVQEETGCYRTVVEKEEGSCELGW